MAQIYQPVKELQRGIATFIEYNAMPLVLKHYFRGGMMASYNRDQYLWTGLTKSRVPVYNR